jgi:hypothetical protein
MGTEGLGDAIDHAYRMIELGSSVDIYDLTGPQEALIKTDAELRAEMRRRPRA